MFLDERKKAILKAVIDDYINTAEPIGSRTIARKHELGLSSATIRNEMADLEMLGYLAQPHTSAGRVPSDKGYRMYVDELMNITRLTNDEIRCIRDAMEVKINEIGQLIKLASTIMSHVTKYTSIALMPKLKGVKIKAIQVVPIDSFKALTIVVTEAGVVRNSMVKFPVAVTADTTITLSNLLDQKLRALTSAQITPELIKSLEEELNMKNGLLSAIISGVLDCLRQVERTEIFMDGSTNMFNHPEFKDIIKAQEFLNILDTKEVLCDLLETFDGDKQIKVKIGTENEAIEVKDYSVILASYSLDGSILGSIGVIGPTRMEYSRVIPSLYYIRKNLNEILSGLIGNSSEE
ncbi:MAG: heat-inducible transcriptional repressor HrcA [Eubacteriales bacterium]|nr:heat-inducible transcriptional repressor HrcA [Eubacteriales bacterium]